MATTHGMSRTRLYRIWQLMRNRCQNERCTYYGNYGGRGITVCSEWQRFEPFMQWALGNGYSEVLTLDRKNNDGGYSPENCRWCDRKTQQNNRRNNLYFEFRGETHTLKEWSRLLCIPYQALKGRLRLGWGVEDMFTIPSARKERK